MSLRERRLERATKALIFVAVIVVILTSVILSIGAIIVIARHL